MWPFRGKAPSQQGEDTPAPVAAPVMRHEWKGMPPTQRAVAEHPLTAATGAFRDDLATRHDPSVISHSLGHHVTAEAPAGLVLAVARPTSRSHGPAMVDRPRVQRRTATPELEPAFADDSGDGATVAPESPPARMSVLSLRRELPVVAFEPPTQRLTMLAPDVEPAPVGAPLPVSRLAPSGGPHEAARPEGNQADRGDHAGSEAIDAAQSSFEAPSPRLTLGQSRRLGLGAPLRQVPSTSVQRAADAHETTSAPRWIDEMPPGPAREPAAPLTSGSMPALTLAPRPMPELTLAPTPMPQSPGPAAPDPLADSGQATPEPVDVEPLGSLAKPRLGVPPAPSAPAHDRPGQLDAVARVGPGSRVHPGPSMPSVRAQRLHDRSAANAGGAPPAPPTTTSPSIAPQPGISQSSTILASGSEPRAGEIARASNVAPIVGRRPLLPGAPVQRSTEAVPPALHEPIGRAFGTDLSDARIDRTDQAAEAATSLQALAFTRGDTVALPSMDGSILATPQRALLAHELTHVAQQRRYGSALPAEDSPAGRRLELQAQAVERSVSRDSTLRLAPLAGAAAIQRAVAQVESSPYRVEPSDAQPVFDSGANVQRADSESIAGGAPLRETVDPRDPATRAAPSNSGGGDRWGGEKAMDELATKLYDKIRSRLKAELLVDRERAGFLTDLR